MNRVMRSTVVLAAALGALSCKGDPTDSLRNGIDHLVATPSALYVDNGTTQSVIIEAVDDQGNRLSGNFQLTAGSFGPGIDVQPDDSFNLVYNENGVLAPPKNWTRARFDVTALQYVSDSFQVTVGGKSLFIPVRVNPISVVSNFLSLTPAVGDTLTLTAPAGLVFDPALTTVTYGTLAAQITAITTTSITFVPQPGSAGQATISNVSPSYAPIGPFTIPTSQSIVVGGVPLLALTTSSPALGVPLVLTLPAPFRFTPSSAVSAAGGAVVVASLSADSSQLSVFVGPGVTDSIAVTNIVVGTAPTLGTYSTKTAGVVTVAPIANVVASFSTTTPNTNDLVTVSAVGYKFLPTTYVEFGNNRQYVTSVAADSSSATFRAGRPGASGTITLGDIALSFLTAVPVSAPATIPITVGATITSLPGTGSLATAPPILIPPTGSTFTIRDAGAFGADPDCTGTLGGPCRAYTFTLTGTQGFAVSASWQGTTDLGIYFFDSGVNVVGTTGCDAKGAGAGGQPETCSTSLPAGTYTLIVDTFSGFYAPPNNVDPTDITITITGT